MAFTEFFKSHKVNPYTDTSFYQHSEVEKVKYTSERSDSVIQRVFTLFPKNTMHRAVVV